MAKAIISKMTKFIEAIEARYIARPFFVWFQHGEDRDAVIAEDKAKQAEL
jgi:hypothetical protein